MSNTEQKVVAIQVAPYKADFTAPPNSKSFVVQPDGANDDTIGHGVYLRYENGETKHVADRRWEAAAVALAKELCKEYQVSIELYSWQVSYINPGMEALRKSYPPSYEALQNKTKSWANHLTKIITAAWEDGVVLSIHDRNGPVNPFPVLSGDYPADWSSYSATQAIKVPEVNFMKAPEAAIASVVAKSTRVKHVKGKDGVDFTKQFLGQYMPKVVQSLELSKKMLTEIRPDHPLDPLLADTTANAAMTGVGVRLQLNPIDHGDAGITQAHVDLLANINRKLADSDKPLGGVQKDNALFSEFARSQLNPFDYMSPNKRNAMYAGKSLEADVSTITGTVEDGKMVFTGVGGPFGDKPIAVNVEGYSAILNEPPVTENGGETIYGSNEKDLEVAIRRERMIRRKLGEKGIAVVDDGKTHSTLSGTERLRATYPAADAVFEMTTGKSTTRMSGEELRLTEYRGDHKPSEQ